MGKMIIKFLGSKANIEEYTQRHKYNSSLLIIKNKFRLLIDYGEIQKKNLDKLKPNAILITHAHPDHYVWTKKNIRIQTIVYLTKETYDYGKFKPENFVIIKPGKKFSLNSFVILPYRVIHSIKCPTIGFKIFLNRKKIIYNPDLVDIINKNKILKNTNIYIGDGSCIRANLVRKKEGKIWGHARISTQINWCEKAGIKKIFFTHLGKETLRKEKDFKRQHPEIIFAYDRMRMKI